MDWTKDLNDQRNRAADEGRAQLIAAHRARIDQLRGPIALDDQIQRYMRALATKLRVHVGPGAPAHVDVAYQISISVPSTLREAMEKVGFRGEIARASLTDLSNALAALSEETILANTGKAGEIQVIGFSIFAPLARSGSYIEWYPWSQSGYRRTFFRRTPSGATDASGHFRLKCSQNQHWKGWYCREEDTPHWGFNTLPDPELDEIVRCAVLGRPYAPLTPYGFVFGL